ncbi:MAG: hypothetical protein ABSH29_26390 [Acidimicrobiales bacterium]|jgi:hypothetical protein
MTLERHGSCRLARLFSPNVCARTSLLTSLPVVTAPSPLDVSGSARLTVDDVARQQFERQRMAPLSKGGHRRTTGPSGAPAPEAQCDFR